ERERDKPNLLSQNESGQMKLMFTSFLLQFTHVAMYELISEVFRRAVSATLLILRPIHYLILCFKISICKQCYLQFHVSYFTIYSKNSVGIKDERLAVQHAAIRAVKCEHLKNVSKLQLNMYRQKNTWEI
ncbi:hypothetical protein ACJX0J_014392, partial [Zea mays]